ncbi:MAG: hypothetical protein COB30_015365 [Ectothiorhodospiraceae bacterium]|nr:hypothetical protein [Ectothiorhodospiraceae bacterium]
MLSAVVAVLFSRSDSVYKSMSGCDVWDRERDATKWPGGYPVVAHPPCRAWGQLRALANPEPGEKELALFAVDKVREFGGVLEHPLRSTLWPVAGLPEPGCVDDFGGWTLQVNQFDWGHRANKSTRLYIVGCDHRRIPKVRLALGEASHVCGTSGRRTDGSRLKKGDAGWRPEITKKEREATPPAFAEWLCELAKRCSC